MDETNQTADDSAEHRHHGDGSHGEQSNHDESRREQSPPESDAEPNHASEQAHHSHGQHDGQDGHGGMHAGHERMFRRRFFVSTLLSIPVLLYSPTLQEWLAFSVPAFPGSEWLNPVFAVVVFAYGGVPFLQMAAPELRDRAPGMMTLISMAISVAFVYSLASVVFPTQSTNWRS